MSCCFSARVSCGRVVVPDPVSVVVDAFLAADSAARAVAGLSFEGRQLRDRAWHRQLRGRIRVHSRHRTGRSRTGIAVIIRRLSGILTIPRIPKPLDPITVGCREDALPQAESDEPNGFWHQAALDRASRVRNSRGEIVAGESAGACLRHSARGDQEMTMKSAGDHAFTATVTLRSCATRRPTQGALSFLRTAVYARSRGRRHRSHWDSLRSRDHQPTGRASRAARGAGRLRTAFLGAAVAVGLRPDEASRRSSMRETAFWTTAGRPGSRPASNATPRTSSTPGPRCSASAATTSSPCPCSEPTRPATARSPWCTSTPTATPGATRMGRIDHGTMFWHAVREGIVDVARSVQIGIRTHNEDRLGFTWLDAGVGPRARAGRGGAARRGASSATRGPTSRSTSTASTRPTRPGPGRRSTGGLSTYQAQRIIRGLHAESTSWGWTWSKSLRLTT